MKWNVFIQDYYKALEDADEKVQLANQIYDLVSKINVGVMPYILELWIIS